MKIVYETLAVIIFFVVVMFFASYTLTTLDMGGHIRAHVLFMEYETHIEYDYPKKGEGILNLDNRTFERKVWTFEDGYVFKGDWSAITLRPITFG